MFVNSCLCIVGTCNIDLGIMDWKSTCHGTVICAVMVQWFCSISESLFGHMNIISSDYEMVWHNDSPQYSMTYMSWFSDFYLLGPEILSYIWKPIWHMNIISPDYEMVYWQNIHLTIVTSISIISHLSALLNIASGNFVIVITKTHVVACTCIQGQIALAFVTLSLVQVAQMVRTMNTSNVIFIQSVGRIPYNFFIVLLFLFFFLPLYIATFLLFFFFLYSMNSVYFSFRMQLTVLRLAPATSAKNDLILTLASPTSQMAK